jgi:hypothetical protein
LSWLVCAHHPDYPMRLIAEVQQAPDDTGPAKF